MNVLKNTVFMALGILAANFIVHSKDVIACYTDANGQSVTSSTDSTPCFSTTLTVPASVTSCGENYVYSNGSCIYVPGAPAGTSAPVNPGVPGLTCQPGTSDCNMAVSGSGLGGGTASAATFTPSAISLIRQLWASINATNPGMSYDAKLGRLMNMLEGDLSGSDGAVLSLQGEDAVIAIVGEAPIIPVIINPCLFPPMSRTPMCNSGPMM